MLCFCLTFNSHFAFLLDLGECTSFQMTELANQISLVSFQFSSTFLLSSLVFPTNQFLFWTLQHYVISWVPVFLIFNGVATKVTFTQQIMILTAILQDDKVNHCTVSFTYAFNFKPNYFLFPSSLSIYQD